MAIQYEFELDDFQKRAIKRLEEDESVFVSAHTSAGKTVVAEYAIGLGLQRKRKVIYTSPIKALSNQKYRELKKRFKNEVGVITGDISVNQEGSVLIMTTEILRNMLLKDSINNQLIKELEFVIFDEVHYLNNAERGVVWEETILLLPKYIKLVMLSATVPNAMEFAAWVGRTRNTTVYVQTTNYRPVPLHHYIYYSQQINSSIPQFIFKTLVKKADNPFDHNTYNLFVKSLNDQITQQINNKKLKKIQLDQNKQERKIIGEKTGHYKQKTGQKNFRFQINKIVQSQVNKRQKKDMTNQQDSKGIKEAKAIENLIQDLKKNDELPSVFFIFSKNRINNLTSNIKNLDLCTRQESKKIGAFIDNSLKKKLKPNDQNLPQFQQLKQLLIRGIGIHHSDLLPIMKEIVEILFTQNLVKVLFATETFAMGVNMPAKSVVFYGIQKNDGEQFRFLKSSEYVQMSGRAGRRGLDNKGKVILFFFNNNTNNNANLTILPQQQDLKTMVDFKGELLQSQFKVTYGLILNLIHVNNSNENPNNSQGQITVNHIIKNTFLENDKFLLLPQITQKINKFSQEIINIDEQLLDISQNIENKNEFQNTFDNLLCFQTFKMQSIIDLKDFRIYQLKIAILIDNYCNFEIGVIVNINEKDNKQLGFYVVLVQQQMVQNIFKILNEETSISNKDYKIKLVQIGSQNILELANDQIKTQKKIMLNKGQNLSNDKDSLKQIAEVLYQFKQNNKISSQQSILQLLKNSQAFKKLNYNLLADYIQDYQQQQMEFFTILQQNTIFQNQNKQKFIELNIRKKELEKNIEEERKFGNQDQGELIIQFQKRINVLTQLEYLDKDQMPLLKSRLGKEMSECNIQIVEFILQNQLGKLDASESAAILSCFVCCHKKQSKKNNYEDEDNDDEYKDIPERLLDCYDNSVELIERIYEIENKNNLIQKDMEFEKYLDLNFNDGHMKVVYLWCQQEDFVQIMKHTNSPEGAIVRTIQRLEQLIRTIKTAAKCVANYQLYEKMEKSLLLIKRDIVFTTSLYLDNL